MPTFSTFRRDLARVPPMYRGAAFEVVLIALAVAIAVPSLSRAWDPLTLAFTALAVPCVLGSVSLGTGVTAISAVHIVLMLAGAALGPAAVVIIAVFAELLAWPFDRRRTKPRLKCWEPVLGNIALLALPYALAAVAFDAFLPAGHLQFVLIVGGATLAAAALSNVITATLMVVVDGCSVSSAVRVHVNVMPAYAISILLATAVIGSYEEFGLVGVVVVIVPLFVFMYTINLLATAQQRARRHAALSWGVLSSLVRTLNERDPSAARHSAAVAAFSYAIAQEVGLSSSDQHLAHTAGLLHDIGRFSFADRILEPGHVLSSEDWRAVRRHPEIGEAMLADLDVYGPVAQVVRAHHERIDGLGYPDGLRGEEIPEVSKVVAVAEVYDTLTANDTYRQPLSSFQAITEMRRVAGTQLEGEYVEALAQLLSGRSIEYRHADAADFGQELAIQKKIADAATGT